MTKDFIAYISATVAGGILVAFGVVLGSLGRTMPQPWQNPSAPSSSEGNVAAYSNAHLKDAIAAATATCQLHHASTAKHTISGDLNVNPKKGGVAGGEQAQSSASAVNERLSESGYLTDAQRIRECVTERTNYFLAYEYSANPPPTKPPIVDPQTGASIDAYVYYEERQGNVTSDGVFKFPKQDRVVAYDKLKPGDILRATSTARARARATTFSDLVTNIEAGQCVKVLDPANIPKRDLKSADSGGWLHIQSVGCPSG